MIKTTCRAFCLAFLLLTIGALFVSAQPGKEKDEKEFFDKLGSLNKWTTDSVLRRKYGQYPEFLTARFGKHKDFDRVVFELKGDLIGYYINYSEPPFQSEAGEEIINVRGKSFVEIQLYPVRSTDENIQANEKVVAAQNKVKMPLITEVQTVEWFEGELRYVIGLNKKTPYRVQVFSNPTRLVVDFKR